MAERRMFAQTIIDSDAFLEMPLSTQALYFHLNMRADDEGFVNNPKKIQRMIGSSEDDLKVLIAKKFIIPFDSGIVVIKHWKIHNYIRKDRFVETKYHEERRLLGVKENGSYTLDVNQMTTKCQPNDNQVSTKCQPNDSIGKYSIGKYSIGKYSIEEREIYKEKEKFKKPTVEEIKAYCEERNNKIDPQAFYDFYESKGWLVGKAHMKDWKASVRTWENKQKANLDLKTVHELPEWYDDYEKKLKEVSKPKESTTDESAEELGRSLFGEVKNI